MAEAGLLPLAKTTAKEPGERPLRLKCVGCDVLARPLYLAAAHSPHVVDLTLLRRGLHDTPPDLRARLQDEIAGAGAEYDAVVLAYGLCGGATPGIAAGSVPLVVPRAHDCITLFLGSRERYDTEFNTAPGTYWYVLDYLERSEVEPPGSTGLLGVGSASDQEVQIAYAEYVERFGRDNADYLMEVVGTWGEHYERAAFVDMGVGDARRVEERAREQAIRRGWRFERLAGELLLIRRLLAAEWDDDFLVLQPGQRLAMTYRDDIICAVQEETGSGD